MELAEEGEWPSTYWFHGRRLLARRREVSAFPYPMIFGIEHHGSARRLLRCSVRRRSRRNGYVSVGWSMLRELCLERWTRWKQQARLQRQRWMSQRAHAMPLDKRVRQYPELFILLRYGAAEGTDGYWVGSLNQRGERRVSVCDDEEAALRAEDYLLRVGAPIYENSEEWQDAVARLAAGEVLQWARVRGRRASGGR